MSTTIPLILMSLGFLMGAKAPFRRLSKHFIILCSILLFYFALHGVSYFFSTYKGYAQNDLIVKIPLIILPVILLLKEKLSDDLLYKMLYSFVISCVLMASFILIRVVFSFLFYDKVLNHLLAVDFTIIHPTYLSMYLLFSFFILWSQDFVIRRFGFKGKIVISFILGLTIIVLSSRVAFVMLSFLIFYILWVNFSWKKSGIATLAFILILPILVWKVPFLSYRFEKAFNMLTQSTEMVNQYTVDDRVMVWKNTIDLIKERPIKGYTVGDYCYHHLKEKHNASGFGKGYRLRLNAHNQFLESWLALGISGILVLLILYSIGMCIAIQKKDKTLAFFLFLCIATSMVESIFQSQGGVMFFGFFIGFFMHKSQQKIEEENDG